MTVPGGGRRETIVVITPIEPSRTGNGLAMRVATLVEAAARHREVVLVVVPVFGAPPRVVGPEVARRIEVEPLPDRPGVRPALHPWLTSDRWRDRLTRTAPPPGPVGRVPLDALDRLAPPGPVAAVLACRLTTSLLGLRLAERLDCPLVVDLDDDDETLAIASGDPGTGAAWHRVAAAVLPHVALALGASDDVVRAVASRHRPTRLAVAPNPAPAVAPLGPTPSDGWPRALMVANFGYAPNREGARWFVHEVLPRLDPTWTLALVGPGAPPVDVRSSRVEVAGYVDDLRSQYERATVAVAPLRAGSGTRIKILEAMAAGRPVVATPVAASGIGVEDSRHLLLADDPDGFAGAVRRAAEPSTAFDLTTAAQALVRTTYDRTVVVDQIARLLAHPHAGPGPASGPSGEAPA
jgi:hypothetical protein